MKEKLQKAAEEGLLISAKWGIVLVVIYLGLTFFTGLVSGANNGTQAALYINQLIEKGYLPKAINGQVPAKVEDEKTLNNSIPSAK